MASRRHRRRHRGVRARLHPLLPGPPRPRPLPPPQAPRLRGPVPLPLGVGPVPLIRLRPAKHWLLRGWGAAEGGILPARRRGGGAVGGGGLRRGGGGVGVCAANPRKAVFAGKVGLALPLISLLVFLQEHSRS
ncbi:hypothetical protein ACP70R_031224 [Stipagrostis hirtigluma subsp. patula]